MGHDSLALCSVLVDAFTVKLGHLRSENDLIADAVDLGDRLSLVVGNVSFDALITLNWIADNNAHSWIFSVDYLLNSSVQDDLCLLQAFCRLDRLSWHGLLLAELFHHNLHIEFNNALFPTQNKKKIVPINQEEQRDVQGPSNLNSFREQATLKGTLEIHGRNADNCGNCVVEYTSL